MKTLKISFLIVGLSLFALQSMARKDEFKKTINKSFDIDPDATLKVTNKFGKINCINWDENRISFEVEITIEASKQEKADKYFDKIKIDFNGTASFVSAVTHMEDNIFNNNNHGDFSVDYTIHMPKTVGINLSNKFGDIIVETVEGKSIIDLGYGSIHAKRLMGPNNEIEIKFSDGYIGYLSDADLELKYSELDMDEATILSAECKFSDFNLGKVDVLTLESGYDDDFIGSVRDLDVEANFSDVDIKNVGDRLIGDLDYGELKVKTIDENFKLIDIKNSFSDVSLGFNPGSSFRVEATVKMGDFSFPEDQAQLTELELSYTSSKYEGLVGNNKETTSKVLIETKNAETTLYYR